MICVRYMDCYVAGEEIEMKAFFASLIVLSMCACSTPEPKLVVQTKISNITIMDVPGDVPEFERTYSSQITPEVSIKLTAKLFLFEPVTWDGELRQSDGRYVFFDPKNPADKILDRDLVAPVEKICKEAISTDEAWRASKPNEWTDKDGTTWRRQ